MDADFCLEALEDAIERHGKPEIMNTDQGSSAFTSLAFTSPLKDIGIQNRQFRFSAILALLTLTAPQTGMTNQQ